MRQVPKKNSFFVPYGIIGNGNLASNLKRYLKLLNIDFKSYKRPNKRTPQEVLKNCETILFATSDKALCSVTTNWHPRQILVHFSGTVSLPNVIALHPLFSFKKSIKLDLKTYQSIPFSGNVSKKLFVQIFPKFKNPFIKIKDSDRSYYHALAVIAGNFTCLLWNQASKSFGKNLSIDKKMLLPYLQSIYLNLKSDLDFFGGPLARKDFVTIKKNLEALKRQNDPLDLIYKAFIKLKGIKT